MGWYGKDIMGGDEPEEAKYYILYHYGAYTEFDEYKPDVYDEENCRLRKDIAEEKQQFVYDKMKEDKVNIITVQVFGVILLNAGATIIPALKEDILKCLRLDSWAAVSLERRILVNEMIEILEAYDAAAPTLEYKTHDITNKERMEPRISKKLTELACTHFKEYCKKWPLVKDVRIGVTANYGYQLILLVDDSNKNKTNKFINNKEFEWNGLYEIPLSIIFTSDFKTV